MADSILFLNQNHFQEDEARSCNCADCKRSMYLQSTGKDKVEEGRKKRKSMSKTNEDFPIVLKQDNWVQIGLRSSSRNTWWDLCGLVWSKGADLSSHSDHHKGSFPSTLLKQKIEINSTTGRGADQLTLEWQLVYGKASWESGKQWKAIKSARLGHDEFSASQLLNAARPHLLADLSFAFAPHLRFRLAMSNHPSHLQTDSHHRGAPAWLMALWRYWKLGVRDASVFDVHSRRVLRKNSRHRCLFAGEGFWTSPGLRDVSCLREGSVDKDEEQMFLQGDRGKVDCGRLRSPDDLLAVLTQTDVE